MNSEYSFSSRYLNQGYSSKAFQSGENDPYLVVCTQNVPTNKPGSKEKNEYLFVKGRKYLARRVKDKNSFDNYRWRAWPNELTSGSSYFTDKQIGEFFKLT